MTRSRRAPALAATAVLGALLTVASPASAEVHVVRDARGDTRQVEARGVRESADVLRLRSEHAGDTIRMTFTLADLDRGSGLYAGVRLRTPTGGEFNAAVSREGGEKYLELYRGWGDSVVRCPGLEGRFLPGADRAVIEVPRSCVTRPRWVQFGGVTAAFGGRTFADDVRRDGAVDDDGLPVLGTRRLHHG